MTTCGAGITAFVATQLGIAIASGPSADGKDVAQGGFVARLDAYAGAQANANRLTAAVLVLDLVVLVVLVVCGLWFVFLWASPGSIAAPRGTTLSAAPDYVAVQAKAFVALVLAGAAGVGVAATK